jgi:NADH dehydrogenase [ubiquinone] 1 alpha subcomplex assembly factor 7
LSDALRDPGCVDLTADVDFAALQRAVGNLGICCGPINQSSFLHQMGIQVRLKSLLSSVSVEQKRQLQSAYKMLTDSDQMGERFKFFAVFPSHGFCPYPFQRSV